MGHESVICQKCHGDNVIAAVNPLGPDAGYFLPPISEAIHDTHKNESEGGVIVFNDGLGRDGGCQGCHPAHRSDGVMDNYPITIVGDNANADGDNRLNQGGCFVGRDVHSNPLKDVDGAETPEHLNAVGDWLVANVARGQGGLAGSERTTAVSGAPTVIASSARKSGVRRTATISSTATAWSIRAPNRLWRRLRRRWGLPRLRPLTTWIRSRLTLTAHRIRPMRSGSDDRGRQCGDHRGRSNGPVGTTDADGDFSVNILSFCTTDDCVDLINTNKGDESAWRYPESWCGRWYRGLHQHGEHAVPVPFSAATDGRDHWLAAGEPHCADCHAAPYVEQSGNINPFPPFNYPAKAGLMRYSRGHQDLSCQGCHESIHGLYPVAAAIDNTSYAQAAALNHDGSARPAQVRQPATRWMATASRPGWQPAQRPTTTGRSPRVR